MKKLIRLIVLFLITCMVNKNLYAESKYEDMSKITQTILLQHCDQRDELKISRFHNNETDRDLFCIEPDVDYRTDLYKYQKNASEDIELYKFYRAYEKLGHSDESFITIQLLIWEYVSGIRYTFDGKDVSNYLENEAKQILNEEITPISEDILIDVMPGVLQEYEIDNIDNYEINFDDVDVFEISENKIKFVINNYSNEPKKIILARKNNIPEGSYIYKSNKSQDLYSFEGIIDNVKNINLNLKTLNDNLSVSFRKTDINNNPIEGAEFTLYELSDEGLNNLYFINTDVDVDILLLTVKNIDGLALEDIKIEVSERYAKYLNGFVINTNEVGYLPFKITYKDQIIKQGRIYVFNNIIEDKLIYKANVVKNYYTTNDEINTIDGLKMNKNYYLCESEPQKGYEYVSNPCVFIDTHNDSYKETFNFINNKRNYTFKLIKNNPDYTIMLNEAKFKLTYLDNSETKEIIFKTGALNIKREDDNRYVIYKHENSDQVYIDEFKNDYFIKDNVAYGTYLYYQSNDNLIDYTKFNNKTYVIEGTYIIEDIPYNSKLTIKELEAPKGYFIEDDTYELNADISYSEITFKNYRVNQFDIIPQNKRRIPKTCIGE